MCGTDGESSSRFHRYAVRHLIISHVCVCPHRRYRFPIKLHAVLESRSVCPLFSSLLSRSAWTSILRWWKDHIYFFSLAAQSLRVHIRQRSIPASRRTAERRHHETKTAAFADSALNFQCRLHRALSAFSFQSPFSNALLIPRIFNSASDVKALARVRKAKPRQSTVHWRQMLHQKRSL